MKIFIAGATGVLGKRMVRLLTAHGHQVVGLARSDANETLIQSLGGIPRRADLFDADWVACAAEGCDVIVHAATAIPPVTKTSPSDWEMNDRIRREGARNLVAAAAKAGVRGYVQQSIVWLARPEDQKAFDENSPVRAEGIYQSAADAEDIAREGGSKSGFPVAILRGAFFYSADSSHMTYFAEQLRARMLPVIGSGKNLFAMVHCDDAASAFVAASEQPKNGVWHITDNQPPTMEEFLTHFAEVIGAPKPQRVMAMLAEMFAGKAAVAFMTANTDTHSRKFQADFGWKPAFPTYKEGLRQIAEEWKRGSSGG